MPIALFLLLEKLVLSPTVQQEAWTLVAPFVHQGMVPPDSVLIQATRLADAAHEAARGSILG